MTYSYGPLRMDEQRLNDQREPIYNSSVPIQDVARKTCRDRWMIETGGERKSGKSDIPYYSPIDGRRELERIIWFIYFPSVLALLEIQTASFRLWNRVTQSISWKDNRYTTSSSSPMIAIQFEICWGAYRMPWFFLYSDLYFSETGCQPWLKTSVYQVILVWRFYFMAYQPF